MNISLSNLVKISGKNKSSKRVGRGYGSTKGGHTTGKGTNKVSLQIKDEKTLSFLSGASFNAGDVGGVDFSIVKNDDKELVAAMWNGTSMNTVVLNKKNGLAIWSKSRSDFPTYDAPSADLSYLICR